jgi:hypothetical protein
MRTSIVGLSALDDRDDTARAARLTAELTHADPLAATPASSGAKPFGWPSSSAAST